MHPSGGMTARAAAREDLRDGIDLVAGYTEVIELAVGEMRQLTDRRTVALEGMDPGKYKSDEHGNSPFEAEAMAFSMVAILPVGRATKQAQDRVKELYHRHSLAAAYPPRSQQGTLAPGIRNLRFRRASRYESEPQVSGAPDTCRQSLRSSPSPQARDPSRR